MIPEIDARPDSRISDQAVIDWWLAGRTENTLKAYRFEINRFLTFANKSLTEVTFTDLQRFAASLRHLAPSSQHRALSAVRSLLKFAGSCE